MKLGVDARDQGLATRLAWITGLRLGFLLLLLGAVAFLYLQGELSRYPVSLRVVFGTIGAAFALTAIYAVLLRRARHLVALSYGQVVLDQLTWTAIVWVSGGVTSGATSFYALTCLVGATLVGLRGAVVSAIVGIAVYTLLGISFHLGYLAPPPDQNAALYTVKFSELFYPLLLNGLGIVVVALLAGYLAERLRITGGELAAVTRRALEAERLAVLGRVAAGLAHEIRNPLGSIRGSIEMLRESPELTDEDRHLCDIIHREAARLNNLVGDMMDLSKPRVARAEAVDVASLARDVVALAARSQRSEDVRVEYTGPQVQTLARCDGAQMRQVVWNLVRNAMQASGAGATVRVVVEPRGSDVLLAVDDRGPGIREAEIEKIFDAFYTTRTHGAGIGLAVVRRIIDEHRAMGATIAIVNRDEGGASFQVTLSSDVTGLRPSMRPPPLSFAG